MREHFEQAMIWRTPEDFLKRMTSLAYLQRHFEETQAQALSKIASALLEQINLTQQAGHYWKDDAPGLVRTIAEFIESTLDAIIASTQKHSDTVLAKKASEHYAQAKRELLEQLQGRIQN